MLLAVPVLEIFLLVRVGHQVGGGVMFAWILATGVAGTLLARQEPKRLGCLISGVLLLVPGLVTDACGLLLLLPPVREGIQRLAARRVEQKMNLIAEAFHQQMQGFGNAPGTEFDGEVVEAEVIDAK